MWNTIYLDQALTVAQAEGADINDDDDIARLGPLTHNHINLAGRHTFNLDQTSAGMLRALRNPAEPAQPEL